MRDPWKLSLAVVGIATTFTLGASAGFLRPVQDEAGNATPSALPSLPPPSPALPPPAPIAAPATFVVRDVGNRPTPQPPPELDSADPWTAAPASVVTSHARRPKHRPLDADDPWGTHSGERALPALPPAQLDASDPWTSASTRTAMPPKTPGRASDDALGEAIHQAIDAGDLDRAAKLLEILRSSR